MNVEGDAKAEMLGRIRAANYRAENRGEQAVTPEADWLAIPREYTRAASVTREALLELLIDRLRDYDAEVGRVASHEIANAIAQVLVERKQPRMLVAEGFPEGLLPDGDLSRDDAFSPVELDGFDGILTEATVAIAETGTLVLQGVPGQGRRAATLVPDFHLCVVRAKDVVQTVAEAVARLAETATLPTTFVSGPSATADIEMTRIKGVHGPRFLQVVLVED